MVAIGYIDSTLATYMRYCSTCSSFLVDNNTQHLRCGPCTGSGIVASKIDRGIVNRTPIDRSRPLHSPHGGSAALSLSLSFSISLALTQLFHPVPLRYITPVYACILSNRAQSMYAHTQTHISIYDIIIPIQHTCSTRGILASLQRGDINIRGP